MDPIEDRIGANIEDGDSGFEEECSSRKRLRYEYQPRYKKHLRFCRVPYLRINPNPFSIAFLILVIFSLGVGPHRYSSGTVSCTPLRIRHLNHRMLVNHHHNNSKSENNSSSTNNSSVVENLENLEPADMFLNSPPQFLKRFGRSSKTIINTFETEAYVTPAKSTNSFSNTRQESSEFSRTFSKSSLFPSCSHIGDKINDVAARAYLAETIFEGKARSKTTIRDPGGKYGVVFVVQQVHKDQSNSQTPLKPGTQVRLYFKQKADAIKFQTGQCVQRYNYPRKPGELTKANIKRGRRYIVFVNGIGPHNYTIVGEPVRKTEKRLDVIRDVLCRNCVRPVSVSGLKNQSLKIGKQLKLVCRSKGNPLPAIQWFKDGLPLSVNSRLRIQYKKQRSLLVIPEVRSSDSGMYECRGIGVQNVHSVQSVAMITVQSRFENVTALWPLDGRPCPVDLVYCLNGGACTYYETIGELMCQCAEGYNGGRCENKVAVNSNSTYEPITCFDGVTPSYPCVTVHKPLRKIDDYI